MRAKGPSVAKNGPWDREWGDSTFVHSCPGFHGRLLSQEELTDYPPPENPVRKSGLPDII